MIIQPDRFLKICQVSANQLMKPLFKSLQKNAWAYLFMLPACTLIVVFFVFPLGWNLLLSVSEWDLLKNTGRFVGLKNYQVIFQQAVFQKSLVNTSVYTIIVVPLLIGLGMLMALLISQNMRGISLFRAIYFIPWVIPWVAAGLIWRFMYNDIYGVINYLLRSSGLIQQPVQFFNNRWVAIGSVTAMVLWKAAGFSMVILLGGLKGIPEQLYEAASIDGASPRQQFWYITLPLMRPAIATAAILAVNGSYLAFDHFFVMTNGAPANTTETILTWAYKVTFKQFHLGYGAAMSIVLLAITGILAALQIRYFKLLKI
ncbi:binding-protein-dependent transport systems inner membrane component [Candidatus Vecturithrix granuli]|uniref:Binding-protein-dependent transport systems inner membrane component n=1 Tax=Vecturithrix granuli TaxID=1499967 RepID=A0A081C8Z1_VECG1|nr:binding-protein-dependent transport systems inner membrane component [Candidatus Vecturithrix granuli]